MKIRKSTFDSNRDTVGKIATEQLNKDFGKIEVQYQRDEMLKEYLPNLMLCVENNKKLFPGDFFIVVDTKTEPLMPNVMRSSFFGRLTCPTPTYDESIYHYHRQTEQLEYIWTVPSKDTCEFLRENALLTHPSQRQLLGFVMGFYDGSLLARCKQLNNEKEDILDSVILEVLHD